MKKQKVCYGNCEKCPNKKEYDKKILEKVVKEAKKRGYLKTSK